MGSLEALRDDAWAGAFGAVETVEAGGASGAGGWKKLVRRREEDEVGFEGPASAGLSALATSSAQSTYTVSIPKEPSSLYNATQRIAQQGATGSIRSLRRLDRRDNCEASGKTYLLLLMVLANRLRLRQVAAVVVPPRTCRVERERDEDAMDAFYALHSRQTESLEYLSDPSGLLSSCVWREMEG